MSKIHSEDQRMGSLKTQVGREIPRQRLQSRGPLRAGDSVRRQSLLSPDRPLLESVSMVHDKMKAAFTHWPKHPALCVSAPE